MSRLMQEKRWHFLKGYRNPHQKSTCRGFTHFLLWQCGFYNDPLARPPVPADFAFPNPELSIDPSAPQVMWINHSTFWVHLGGKNFLVDPIWNERCSPFTFIGPKRYAPPSHTVEELGKIDYIILSHNHYDHLDRSTLLTLHRLHPEVTWIVPLKLKKWILKTLPQVERVIELDWWDQFETEGLLFTAVPAQHFSGRGLFDRNRTLWMGCVVESIALHKRFYFVGDTGYNPYDFRKIGEHFSHMDLSLIPIGVYTPRQFMRSVHVSPEEAVQIHQDVRSMLSIGGHWGTFKLSSDCLTRPPYDLFCALEAQQDSWETFRVLRPGQLLNW